MQCPQDGLTTGLPKAKGPGPNSCCGIQSLSEAAVAFRALTLPVALVHTPSAHSRKQTCSPHRALCSHGPLGLERSETVPPAGYTLSARHRGLPRTVPRHPVIKHTFKVTCLFLIQRE